MTATFEQARDEVLQRFNTAWMFGASSVVGYTPDIIWPGKEPETTPDGSKHWVRISCQSVIEQQAGFRSSPTNEGRQRYASTALVFVQIFCPKTISTSFNEGQKLANIAKLAFRGKKTPLGVVFKEATIKELDPELNYHRFNVIAEFEYDEIG